MTAPWKHARRQAQHSAAQRDKARARLQHKPEPAVTCEEITAMAAAYLKKAMEALAMPIGFQTATEALAMPIMSKEMALQAHVEEMVAKRQGWQLVELAWEPDTHRVRLGVRCPHGQTGVMWSQGVDTVPPAEVADMLLDTLRGRCEQDHQQLPDPSIGGLLLPYAIDATSTIIELRKVFPGLAWMVTPPYGGPPDTVDRIILGLNDRYSWSRERIADWLDTLHEPGLTAQPTSQGD